MSLVSKDRIGESLDKLFKTSPLSGATSSSKTQILSLRDSHTGENVRVSKDAQFHFMCKASSAGGQTYVTGLLDSSSISRVESNGTVTHLRLSFPKGEEKIDPHGIVLSESRKRLYFADSRHHVIRCVDLNTMKTRVMVGALGVGGHVDGSRVDARLKYPCELVISLKRKAIYVADSYNYSIRRIDLKDGAVSTIVGGVHVVRIRSSLSTNHHIHSSNNTTQGKCREFLYPTGLAIGPNEDILFVTDTEAHTIRCVDIERKEVTTIAGQTNSKGMKDGAASQSLFCGPRGIAFSSRSHGLYVSDTLNHAVRFIKLDKSSSKAISVTTVCGSKDGSRQIRFPDGIVVSEEEKCAFFLNDAGIGKIPISSDSKISSSEISPSTMLDDLKQMIGDKTLPQGRVTFVVGPERQRT